MYLESYERYLTLKFHSRLLLGPRYNYFRFYDSHVEIGCGWWQWQCHRAAGSTATMHPRPRVADRGTPSRMVKRVAPDKEGAADKQCLRRRTTPISNRGGWSSLNLFRYIHLGECHSEVKHGTWAAAGFVPEMAEEPHYGQRYPGFWWRQVLVIRKLALSCGVERNRKLQHSLLRQQQMTDDGTTSE